MCETLDKEKPPDFFDGDDNLSALFKAKMAKELCFSLISFPPTALAWGISWPHISTCENLHARQKHLFSGGLRVFQSVF
jgi:hypothetical protein